MLAFAFHACINDDQPVVTDAKNSRAALSVVFKNVVCRNDLKAGLHYLLNLNPGIFHLR